MSATACLRAAALGCALFSVVIQAARAQSPAPVQAPSPVPAAHFFSNAAFDAPKLSPGGSHLAMLAGGAGQRQRLVVIKLDDRSAQVVAQFGDADVGQFQWVNDERLLFASADQRAAQGEQEYAPGLYAVNRDGSGYRQLANRRGSFVNDAMGGKLLPWHTYMLQQPGAQDGDSVYVANVLFKNVGQGYSVELLKLNTVNGKASDVDAPGNMNGWLLDQQGEPRLSMAHGTGTGAATGDSTISYRDAASGAWRALASFNPYTGAGGIHPLGFGPDGTLYARANAGQDLAAVHTVDLASGKLSAQPLFKLDGYDFQGHLIFDKHKLLGARYHADGADTLWFDPAMKAVQAAVDAKLPGMANLVTPPARPHTPWVLVSSYSDRQPMVHFAYNTESKLLARVGASHPEIKAQQMGKQAVLRYAARDGLQIPALLTLPAGHSGKLPLVVLVHGGPYVRGTQWRWEPQAQFLASRGYAVLEPEFRGSAGYGASHFRAGWKQWGLKMQDDIADGAKWAVDKGIADPQRICIAGASYGGYATLMGLVNNPALFKCGVAWAGVTDINLLFTGHWRFTSDLSEQYKQYGMPELVGDPVKLAGQFAATSPLKQAARITQPLLLAYGGADQRVPLIHGTTFRDAVQANNKQVEWIEYEKEGHGWALPENRIDFWTRVEHFLNRHIGTQAANQAANQAATQAATHAATTAGAQDHAIR